MPSPEADLVRKRRNVVRSLSAFPGLVVALSGGVDSAVLLALAVEALGVDRVIAATGASAAVPSSEIDEAAGVARQLGVRHEIKATGELDREGYRSNRGDRCFHCRAALFEVLGALAGEFGSATVAYGAIADDLEEHRPGMKAAADRGVLAPLLDAGFRKAEIRALARDLGLIVRDKPSEACLASRIPAGTPVTVDLLSQVGRAEASLRGLGLGQLRVRHHGDLARVELDPARLGEVADPEVRRAIIGAIRGAGYRFVTLDLEGYRAGGGAVGASGIGPKAEGGQ